MKQHDARKNHVGQPWVKPGHDGFAATPHLPGESTFSRLRKKPLARTGVDLILCHRLEAEVACDAGNGP